MNEIVLNYKEKRELLQEFECSRATLYRAINGSEKSALTRLIRKRAKEMVETREERNRITNTESHA